MPNNQKIRNLQHNPHVVVTLDDTKHGDDVTVVEGKAELLNDANLSTTLSAYAEKYAPLLKEMGWTPESMAAEYSQAIRVTPTKFLGF
jgi:PPOX class probable F420-dependent enzyme